MYMRCLSAPLLLRRIYIWCVTCLVMSEALQWRPICHMGPVPSQVLMVYESFFVCNMTRQAGPFRHGQRFQKGPMLSKSTLRPLMQVLGPQGVCEVLERAGAKYHYDHAACRLSALQRGLPATWIDLVPLLEVSHFPPVLFTL